MFELQIMFTLFTVVCLSQILLLPMYLTLKLAPSPSHNQNHMVKGHFLCLGTCLWNNPPHVLRTTGFSDALKNKLRHFYSNLKF